MRLPLLFFITESFGHAIALLHGMLAVLVNWVRDIKELLIVSIEIVLSMWLHYSVDKIVWSAAM